MASTYSNLKFELIGTGDQSGTWGTTTNTNLGTAIEQAIVGMATISSGFTGSPLTLTLTLTDTNAAQNARALVLNLTQALGSAGTLNVPAIQKPYMVINATGQTVTVKVTGLTGVAVPTGTRAFLYNNGTDVGDFFNYASSLTLGTDLAIADGGTGASTAPNARTNLGATTVGSNLFTLTNPSAITFLRINADNTVSALDAATFRTAIGAGTTSGAAGSNTQVQYNNAGAFAGSSNLTFDGTSLTLGGNPTLSAGTANGVLYLNGSKVATSGSALTFNGTSLGIGSSAYGDAGTITASIGVAGTTAGGLQLWASSAQEHYIQWGDSTTGSATYAGAISYSHASDFMRFWTNSTEQMRLTSTGLGIGTSSPTTKLYVTVSAASTACAAFFNTDTANGNGLYVKAGGSNSGKYALAIDNAASSSLLYLDASGNLGLGLTPSGWYSTWRNIEIGGADSTFAGNGTGPVRLVRNAYINSGGTWIYKNTDFASHYQQASGIHSWHTAPSGTAGNAITFTQAMTLDASGNLGIGTSSPGAKLHVSGSNAGSVLASYILNTSTSASSDAQQFIYVNGATAGDAYTTWTVGGVTSWSGGVRNSDSDNWYLSPGGSLATSPTLVATTSGNLGLGVTPSAWNTGRAIELGNVGNALWSANQVDVFATMNAYQVSGGSWIYASTNPASLFEQYNGNFYWKLAPSGTAGNAITFTQAMTLDASGNLGIGQTSPASISGGYGTVTINGSNGGGLALQSGGTSRGFIYVDSLGVQYSATSTNPHIWYTNGTERARISSAGGFSVGTTADPGAGAIYATGAITAFYSDRRLKDVKGTIVNALDKVASLSGVYYTNNEVAVAHGYTSAETQVGLLAQDVEAVLPEVVKAAPFDLDEKGNSKSGEHYKTIQYERVIPLLVEAIKELRAEVQALRG